MKAALAPAERNTNLVQLTLKLGSFFGAPARSDDQTPDNFDDTIYYEPYIRKHG